MKNYLTRLVIPVAFVAVLLAIPSGVTLPRTPSAIQPADVGNRPQTDGIHNAEHTAQRAPTGLRSDRREISPPGSPACPLTACVAGTINLVNNTTAVGDEPVGNSIDPATTVWDSGRDEYFVTGSFGVGIFSGATNLEVGSVVVGATPQGIAYDPANGEVFVANSGSNSVSVINDTNDSVVATITVGTSPDAVAFDNATNSIYVANDPTYPTYGSLSIISTLNDTAWASIGLTGGDPEGVAYDSATGEIYVSERGAAQVEYVDGSNQSLAGQISVGGQPIGVVAVPEQGDIYVANLNSGSVSVISDVSHTVVQSISPTSSAPYGIAYDSGNGNVYLTDNGNDLVVVINATDRGMVDNISAGNLPEGIAADPTDGSVYELNWGVSTIWAISTSTNSVVARFGSGPTPNGIATDTGNSETYVADTASSRVLAISSTTDQIVGRIPVQRFPYGVVYVPDQNEVYVTNEFNDSVSIISDVTNSVLQNVTLPSGSQPTGLAYDGPIGEVFVADYGTGFITVINTTNRSVAASISVGASAYPESLVYDPSNGYVYDANWGGNVGVIAPSTNTILTTIAVGGGDDLGGIAYDPDNGTVLVTDANGYVYSDVYEINDTSNMQVGKIITAGDPAGVGYAQGNVYVMDQRYNRVDVYSEWNGTSLVNLSVGKVPTTATVDAATSDILVTDMGSGSVSIVSPYPRTIPVSYEVIFIESGLPNGTLWWANVTGGLSVSATTTSVHQSLANGTYPFEVQSSISAYGASSGTVVISGAPIQVNVTFSLIGYNVTVSVSGLPEGGSWFVNLTGPLGSYKIGGGANQSGEDSVVIVLPNGSYNFIVVSDNRSWTPTPQRGTFDVAGGPAFLTVVFHLFTSAAQFTETGLLPDVGFYVNVSGQALQSTNLSQLGLNLPNGTYAYTYGTPDPRFSYSHASGSFAVEGSGAAILLTFTLVQFAVVFSESGLPSGAYWHLAIGNHSVRSPNSSIEFSEPNGSFSYSVAGPAGWQQSTLPYTGSVVVSGQGVDEPTLVFSQVVYALSFGESGLTNGTEWSVDLSNGLTGGPTSFTISFIVPNGTYNFTVPKVSGFGVTPSSGEVTINGKPATVTVQFNASTQTTPPVGNSSSSNSGASYFVIAGIGAVVLVLAIALALVVMRRQRPPPPTTK